MPKYNYVAKTKDSKTVKDIEKWYIPHHQKKLKRTYQVSVKQLKEEAIKFFIYAVKKGMNPYRIFLRFHNIREEDIK